MSEVNIIDNIKILDDEVDTAEIDNCRLFFCGAVRLNGEVSDAKQLNKCYRENSFSQFYHQLSGQFWLVIADSNNKKVFLINDVMGIKPCYYTIQNDNLYVSSSLKTITHNDKTITSLSSQAIYHYFYFHCIPSPQTIYEECFKLAPGYLVTVSQEGNVTSQNLYRPQFAKHLDNQPATQQTCLDVIDKTVEQQSTSNCGAFLSGGLDSSTVAGMLAKHQQPAKTFSIGFEVPAYDETAYAKITARHFNTLHEILYIKPEMAANEFVKVAQYFDEPFGNSSAMAAYFCASFAKKHGVTHLLAGDGGDELFAGNERYAKQKVFEYFHQAPLWLKALPRLVFDNQLAAKLPGVKKATSYIRQADVPLPDRLETYNFIQQFGAEQMFEESFLQQVDTEHPIQLKRQRYDECDSADPVDKMLYLDWKFTLADNDLVKVTKMCELAGVTVNFPLLDRKLIDFSCTIPAEAKLPGGELRDFYKKSCQGFLADKTLSKSKHGFGLPFGIWMKENQQLKNLAMQSLQSFRTRNIVKESLIKKALAAHESVHAGYYGELIWIMVILELWLQGNE